MSARIHPSVSVAPALLTSTPSAAAAQDDEPKATVVLEHGAWADASSWAAVVRRRPSASSAWRAQSECLASPIRTPALDDKQASGVTTPAIRLLAALSRRAKECILTYKQEAGGSSPSPPIT